MSGFLPATETTDNHRATKTRLDLSHCAVFDLKDVAFGFFDLASLGCVCSKMSILPHVQDRHQHTSAFNMRIHMDIYVYIDVSRTYMYIYIYT